MKVITKLLTVALLSLNNASALPQGIHKWDARGGKLILVHGTYQDVLHYRRNFSFYFQPEGSPEDWLQVPIRDKKGIPNIGWDTASHGETTLADGAIVQRSGDTFFVTAVKRRGKGGYEEPGDVTITWHRLYDAGDNDHDGTAQLFVQESTRVVRAVAGGVEGILEKESSLPYIRMVPAESLVHEKIIVPGKAVSAMRLQGKEGEQILVLSEKQTKSANGRVERTDLNASLYSKIGNHWKSDWMVNDFVDCPGLDSKAAFFTDATTITDIDKDGKPEVTLAYQLFCGGGVEPSTIKVILRQGETKLAIRGESLIRLPGQAPIGGNRTPDAALQQPKNAPFLKHLEYVWNSVYVEKR